ncbi:protein FAM193A isoform X2 [Stegostoma tigrinum]|uniref:protein FAM193A isoform X2 n=1 Tax=Stegostoma tigrinum TaxID=3053191 RepID=UPI00202B6CB6|nr:protein FAM193A isoform X2 [Stegostoma tigrinum]
MSPADAKRAKRRKNKRGGGKTVSRQQKTLTPSSSNGSSGGGGGTGTNGTLHGEVSINGTQLSDGTVGSEFGEVPQTPFTFGLGQRAPYSTGERCLLCRSERKDSSLSESGITNPNKMALSTSPKTNSMLHLPLWVCPDCRRTVEKDDRQVSLEQSLVNQDFLLHMPMANNGAPQDSIGGRLAVGTQSVPGTDVNTTAASEIACNCEACNERREISAENERESQQLQHYWSEVRYMVRCIYRQAGTPLADDQDQSLVPDKEGMKELVDRLCERDPYQLYQRLEQQAREYVLEMKVRLLRHLSLGSKVTTVAQGPPQAHQFISLLLEEYSALCQAARTISTFLITLESEHLKKFQVTWELHNKHLFENLVFSEPLLQSSLPSLVAQLRLGTASHDSYSEDMYSTLLQRYLQMDQEMSRVAAEWLECQKRIDDYVDEQMAMKTKQRMLKEDWEFFKQRRLLEEQLTNSKKALTGENNFTDTMRHMLSSRLSMPDCPNCNYRRRCTCDDCSLSHILTCGIMDSSIPDDLSINTLPLQVESAPDYLSEIRPPSMSSASSGSGSSSPITIQQHPRLILADSNSAPTFGSDDEDVTPLSAKFADIYPLNSYDDAEVVANMNGIHGELNGGGENMALKDESPPVSSTSSSSSEVDDEDGDDGESSSEPPASHPEEMAGKRVARKEEVRRDSPPPSYPSQQADQVQNVCECHVCKQEGSGLNTSALAAGRLPNSHQFLPTEKPSHPALHLYPHIHGHLPLHTIPHLPRPLLHPTLYATTPPFTHNKALPSAPPPNHTSKHQVFNASLQDHIYPSCFGSTDWNNPLLTSHKLASLWGSELINGDKPWNPAAFLPETLSGDVLGSPLPEIRPEALPPTTSTDTAVTDTKEKKPTSRKKCLYNTPPSVETNKVIMATSSATSSVSSTATTVQSSSNQFKVSSKRPTSLGEVFHSLGKDDHRHPTPVAPRNSPTGLTSLPSLAPTPLSPASAPHMSNLVTSPFPKTASTAPGFVDSHSGLCPTSTAAPAATTEGSVSASASVCSDPDCEGHPCESSNVYDHQQFDGEESQDEDSCSEHSSSTSTSTNQKEGKYCDCCYCEFFGHGGPPAAPTSRNYAEMREKLRLRLTKRKEEQPKKADQILEKEQIVDHRKVEDLLQFINSTESKPVSSTRAAKRARHKQRKEEKARLEAEAREREQLQLLEEQRRQEEEERLKQELQRLQELQQIRSAKKKKKERIKESQKNECFLQNARLKETAVELVNDNGKSQHPDTVAKPPNPPPPQTNSKEEQCVLPESSTTQQSPANGKDPRLTQAPSQREAKAKQPEGSISLELSVPNEVNGKQKVKSLVVKQSTERPLKPTEGFRPCETYPKSSVKCQAELGTPKPKLSECQIVAETRKEEKKGVNSNGKKLNHVKEEKVLAMSEPAPSNDQQQVNKNTAESPQPKGKTKKNKKKKGDKLNSSIDDVFLPKDIDLDSVEMDETEREVEYFKRFCLDSARQNRQRLSINWSNFSLKKTTFAAH